MLHRSEGWKWGATALHASCVHSSEFTHGQETSTNSEGGGSAPYSMLVYADNTVSMMLLRWIPVFVSGLIVKPHMSIYFTFIFWCSIEETLCMSGYSFFTGYILGGMVKRAADHFMFGGEGDYGVLGLMDWVCGTQTKPVVKKGEEVEKKEKREKKISNSPRESMERSVTNKMEEVNNGLSSKRKSRRPKNTTA